MNLDWLKTLAPTVATALGGPLAGLAVNAVGTAFGWTDATKEKVEEALTAGQLSGEQVLQLKQAELALQAQEKEIGVKFADLEVQDRASARDMQKATHSPVPAVLSIAVTLGYFAILIGMMTDVFKVQESQALLIMLGSLGTAWGMVMAFWFGNTRSSENKTEMLAKAPAIAK